MLDISQCRQRGVTYTASIKVYLMLGCTPAPAEFSAVAPHPHPLHHSQPQTPLRAFCLSLPSLTKNSFFSNLPLRLCFSVCFGASSSRCHNNKRAGMVRGLKLNNLCTATLNTQTGCSQNIQKATNTKEKEGGPA